MALNDGLTRCFEEPTTKFILQEQRVNAWSRKVHNGILSFVLDKKGVTVNSTDDETLDRLVPKPICHHDRMKKSIKHLLSEDFSVFNSSRLCRVIMAVND